MDRNTNRPRLVGNRAGDRLADPPGGIGGEFIAAAVFKFLDSLHQTHVPFLDQVEEGEAAVGVFLRDGDDKAEVGFDHLPLRFLALVHPALKHPDIFFELVEGATGSKLSLALVCA